METTSNHRIIMPKDIGLISKTPVFDSSINQEINTEKLSESIKRLERNVRHIVAQHGFDDSEWAQAISSQYFLLNIAKILKWEKKDYENLVNKCLSSFNVTYTGNYVIDDGRLLITPDETVRIMECMQKEDEIDTYFTRSAKMKAKNIDSQQMYFNYHYGLLIKIVSSENTEVLKAIKYQCLNSMLEDKALDNSDGWYPYRVPWITGRILISLKDVDFSDYVNKDKLNNVIAAAIESLYQRLDEKAAYWRSGVGDWVSKWESTALCMEALYVWNKIRVSEFKLIVDYVCSEISMNEWLSMDVNFYSEESSNKLLSSVVLASTVYKVTRDYFSNVFFKIQNRIINYFSYVIKLLNSNPIEKVRQYCTVPQILFYILSACKAD